MWIYSALQEIFLSLVHEKDIEASSMAVTFHVLLSGQCGNDVVSFNVLP